MLERNTNNAFDNKLIVLGVFMLLCMSVLIGGLWKVQILSSKEYEEKMLKQYGVSVRIPAVRGKILDANGKAMAENRPSFTVNLYLEELRELYQAEYLPVRNAFKNKILKQEGKDRRLKAFEYAEINKTARYNVIQRLVGQLNKIMNEDIEISSKAFENHYNSQLSMPLAIMTDISLNKTSRFLETVSLPPGFDIDVQPLRTYPLGDVAAQTLGHMKRITSHHQNNEDPATKYQLPDYEGVAGLERHFEKELRGKPGVKNITVNYLGYRTGEEIIIQPSPGKDLHLTIDSDIQKAAQDALLRRDPNLRGAAVVMDCKSGDLMAIASVPSFNPNDFIPKISQSKWDAITRPDDPSLKKMMNRSYALRYQPGSVFKIVIAMALLESEDFNPDDLLQTYWVFSRGERPNQIRVRDTAAPGEYDFIRAFKKSSNYYFVQHGLKVGRRNIIDISHKLGLEGQINLPVSQGARGIIPSDDYLSKSGIQWTAGRTANLSIGQGELDLTPVHVAQIVAAIGNNGKIPKPRLVTKLASNLGDDSDETIYYPIATQNQLNLKQRSFDYIKRAMLADVADRDGTGHNAFVAGMDIGGKTGTAESRTNRTTWFASMAPVHDPKYVVVVMVEKGRSGGDTCAPIAKEIYLAIKKKFYPSMEEFNSRLSSPTPLTAQIYREGGQR